tara:strand:+ start:122498 stop:124576 length:2079 start_codon:yes stop_codon:yes gene_type:complete
MRKLFLLLFAMTLSFCKNENSTIVEKKLTISSLFTDHMVLQQQDEVTIWGESDPNQLVSITPNWQYEANSKIIIDDKIDVNIKSKGSSFSCKPNSNGKWSIKIPTPKAGGPYSIIISTGVDDHKKEWLTINDVMIGEVWLASGQSNMDMPLSGWMPNDSINDSADAIANAKNLNIRFFKVPFGLTTAPQDSIAGEWVTAAPETAKDFSATAYFFARKLQKELNVPVGIIQSAVGGTPAEAWTSKNSLRELGDFNGIIDQISEIESKSSSWFKDRSTQPIPQTHEAWKSISFGDKNLSLFDYDDSDWSNSISIPGRFDLINNGEFDGAVWLRKTFFIEDKYILTHNNTLIIGGVDDMDATYINGKYVGGLVGTGQHHTLREFIVPKSILKLGKNTIAIRAIDTGGPGEVLGPILLKSEFKTSPISLDGQWKKKLIADIFNGQFVSYDENTDMVERPNLNILNSNSPTVLYNAMIAPLVPYTIKGAIWYQGESNVSRDEQYQKLFPMMIKDWRKQWNSEFPFYYVQIAPFTYGGNQQNESQKLRNAQRLALETPKTGMVVTLDIGKEFNIHPPEKQRIGTRLAGLALTNDYGKAIVASGPLFKAVKVDGNTLIVEFTNIGTGLMADKKGLTNFEIAGADKNYKPANAKIIENKVVVTNTKVTNPVYVRYAWSDTSTATLFNNEGLPASTFTSEK